MDREFGNLLKIQDNYPKIVVSMDKMIEGGEGCAAHASAAVSQGIRIVCLAKRVLIAQKCILYLPSKIIHPHRQHLDYRLIPLSAQALYR